jgi:putative membrane protein
MKRYGIFRLFKTLIPIRSLDDQDRSRLETRIAETEKNTGAQIVLSVIERCDDYPELPWKAFALGVALSCLALLAMDISYPDWISGTTVLLVVAGILTVGAVFALVCIFVPGFARIFLDQERSELETRQYAECLFLDRELFTTKKRTGILLLIGLFERQVVILPDTGLIDSLNLARLEKIIDQMTQTLASGNIAEALEQGLLGLEQELSHTKPRKPVKNELSNEIIEEKDS